jgi:hypothetical protein
MAKGMTKGALGKGVYRGDEAGVMTGNEVVDDFKIAEQFLPSWGALRGCPPQKGGVEKPQALKRGGRLSPL